MNTIKKIVPKHGYYIAGFADGEGSFNVSIKSRKDYKKKWKLTASFNVSQKERHILAFIKKTLGCGTLRERKDGIVYYEVTNIASLHNVILPFFKRFPILSQKKNKNFHIFAHIVKKMYKKEHLTPEGFREIITLRESLNDEIGRARKYTLKDVLKDMQ